MYKSIQAFDGKIDNARMLNSIRVDASQAYQQRIPPATQGDITATVNALQEFQPHMNEFLAALVNRIADVIIRSKSWSNPLAQFKRGMMQYGDTIEEIATELVMAHQYDPNCCYEDVWKCHRPEVMTNFHHVNRQNYYPLTITEPMLRRAFLSEYGLSELVSRLLSTIYTSDYWDEYLIMRNLFVEYGRIDGFHKIQVPDLETAVTVEQRQNVSMQITEAIRAITGKLQFLSTDYNAGGMPTYSRPSDLVLFATPEFIAALDVNVIAFAFHTSAADLPTRIVTVDEIPIDGAVAILADRDFFVCADTLMEFRSIPNPKQLSWNYWWHHHGIYSVSRFVNAILFTTEAGVSVTVPEITINSVEVKAIDHSASRCCGHHEPDMQVTTTLSPSTVVTGVSGGQESPATATTSTITATNEVTYDHFIEGTPEVVAGGRLRCVAIVKGSVSPEDARYVIPQGVVWSISETSGKKCKIGTFIDAEGVLHVDPAEENTSLTVCATTTYIAPEKPLAEQSYKTGTLKITVKPCKVKGRAISTSLCDEPVVVKNTSSRKKAN